MLAATGCAAVNRRIDDWALAHKAATLAEQPWEPTRGALPFLDAAGLERLTRPAGPPAVQVTPLGRHRLADPTLVQEQLSFPSALPLRLAAGPAHAYLYRHGPLGARPVVLFVPGQHVSGADFPSLERYFAQVLDRGLDLAFFVPPYHLERSPPGFGSGDAFMATDFPDHLRAVAQEVGDLRALAAWLRAQGVDELGAVAASMGAGLVLLLSTWEPVFGFVTALQPLLDWNALLALPEMAPVRQRLAAQGYPAAEVAAVYAALDPRRGSPTLPPSAICVLYGRYDQIAPEPAVRALIAGWGLRRVHAYDRGHVLLPVWTRVDRDLGRSLDVDLVAIRWRRWFASGGRAGR